MAPKSFVAGIGLILAWLPLAEAVADYRDLSGVWASEGYGRLLEVEDGEVRSYAVTKISCVLQESRALDEFLHRIDRVNRSDENQFGFYSEGEITRYGYTRLPKLPEICSIARGGSIDANPERNFEVFWHSFEENYAFFDTRGVDWRAVYGKYRPRVTASTSSAELFALLSELIFLLDDPHVVLLGDGLPRRNSGHPGTLTALLQKELGAGKKADRAQVAAAAKAVIAEHYLEGSPRQAANGKFTWGWIAEGVGYVSIDSMRYETATVRESHRLVDEIMARVIADLRGAKGIVVDARWNGGGHDSNALHIAGHFTDRSLLAFTKRARNGAALTARQEILIPCHAAQRFTGPVVYLSSRDTLSAAEILSLAMKAIPNGTSLGEPSAGALSDMLSVVLPNGWRVTMSNEVYEAIDGKVYEGTGVPVDISLPPPEDATLESYIRLVTDRAIAMLQ